MAYDPEYGRQYRTKNKERLKQKFRAWYKSHKKQVIENVTKIHKDKMQDPDYADKVRKCRAKSERKSCRKPKRREKILERKAVTSQLKDEIKLHYMCLNPDCKWQGNMPAYCLDFHHIDRKSKKFSIGAISGRSIKTLLEEIDKCTVLCAICHRQENWGNLDVSSFQRCDTSKLTLSYTK